MWAEWVLRRLGGIPKNSAAYRGEQSDEQLDDQPDGSKCMPTFQIIRLKSEVKQLWR
jgi:hypothetical protein